MNGDYELPAGETNESEVTGESARLEEIERCLKKARPRPPQLDAAVLEKLLKQGAGSAANRGLASEQVHDTAEPVPFFSSPLERLVFSGSPDPAVDSPMAMAARREWRGRERRLYRGVAMVAGSWACGTVVGAIAMFLFMSRTGPGEDLTDGTAQHHIDSLAPRTVDKDVASRCETVVERGGAPGDRPPVNKARPLDPEIAALAMLAEPLARGRWGYGPDGPMLRAGTHLRQSVWAPPIPPHERADATTQRQSDRESWKRESPREPASGSPPRPAVTRERLMNDLLREMADIVL